MVPAIVPGHDVSGWGIGPHGITWENTMLRQYILLQDMIRARRDERGATAVEYGLLVVLIAAVIVGVVATIGQDVLTGFTTVEQELP